MIGGVFLKLQICPNLSAPWGEPWVAADPLQKIHFTLTMPSQVDSPRQDSDIH